MIRELINNMREKGQLGVVEIDIDDGVPLPEEMDYGSNYERRLDDEGKTDDSFCWNSRTEFYFSNSLSARVCGAAFGRGQDGGIIVRTWDTDTPS